MRWKRALALFFSTALAFVVVEVGLRAVHAVKGEPPPQPDRSLRREWRWASEHLEQGAPRIEGQARFDALLGWAVRPHLREPGLTTNSVGMRGSREFSEERTDRPRILFVGDSYTFGVGVEDDETYPAVLANGPLAAWEILNLAVPGYGADQMLLMYETVGRRYRPDVVALGFFVRGYERIFGRFRSYAKPWFERDARGELVLRGVPVPSPEKLYAAYASGPRRIGNGVGSYVLAELGKALGRATDILPPRRNDPEWQLLARILERFHDQVRADGAVPLLVIVPTRDDSSSDLFHDRVAELAREEARSLGMTCVSLVDELAGVPEEAIFKPDELGGHFSPNGNRRAAERIHAALVREGLAQR